MPICQYCGGLFHYLLFKCKWCDMSFCRKHRLPVNHDCIFRPSRKNILLTKKTRQLYREGTNQANEILMPEEIFIGVKNKIISKTDALKYLTTSIEHSKDSQVRVECLEILNQLNLKDKNLFKILESILVSDENIELRNAAVKTILKFYPKEGYNVIEWVFDNEKSVTVLKTLKDILKTADNKYIRSLKRKIIDKDN